MHCNVSSFFTMPWYDMWDEESIFKNGDSSYLLIQEPFATNFHSTFASEKFANKGKDRQRTYAKLIIFVSAYSLFERQEAAQSDLGYDYTVVQIEVSVEMDWASFSVVSHITYSSQSEMRALMGNRGSGSALHLDRWVFLFCSGALEASETTAVRSRESRFLYCGPCSGRGPGHPRGLHSGSSLLLPSTPHTCSSRNPSRDGGGVKGGLCMTSICLE